MYSVTVLFSVTGPSIIHPLTAPTHPVVVARASGPVTTRQPLQPIRWSTTRGVPQLCLPAVPMATRLSSISTPREAIGRRAAEHLLTVMAGNKIAKPVVDMGFELQVREST